jgi:hypothetical protein
MPVFLDVDPRTLHVPPPRVTGADPGKFARQLSRYGRSTAGMPVIWVIRWVIRDGGGRLQIMNGVTRATRVARLLPGQTVRVEVIEEYPNQDFSHLPTIGDLIP